MLSPSQYSRHTLAISGLCLALLLVISWHLHSVDLYRGGPRSQFLDLSNPSSRTEKLAYATWFSETIAENGNITDWADDDYFNAVRLLTYQILHAPATRTASQIPLLVLVAPDVPEDKRQRLRKDGATVVPVQYIRTGQDWITPAKEHWRDVISKLRLWELTEYDRILFVDADTILQKPLDGVFDDPGSKVVETQSVTDAMEDEAPLPSNYLMAATGEIIFAKHEFPPLQSDFKSDGLYFCAGFFMLKPSLEMFNYYMSVLSIEGRFDPRYPEQNLMNYAHRPDGNMPWTNVSYIWNMRQVSEKDYDGGVVSMHQKWWTPNFSERLAALYISLRWKMAGFFEARDMLMNT